MKFFLTIFLSIAQLCSCYEYELSIGAIFQDEAPYLKEWIDYHLSVGVDHFWLYNNNSTDNYQEVLQEYCQQKIVELVDWPSLPEENDWAHYSFIVQTGAYNDILGCAKASTRWLALIDTDEFLVPVIERTVPEILNKYYSDVSGLCVNWQCYGTSYILRVAEGKLLQHLTWKMRWDHPWNKHSKSIVNPRHVAYCPNPHFCLYTDGHWAVDSYKQKTDDCPSQVLIDKIRINHYWTRDQWYLENKKVPRYQRWGISLLDVYEHADEMNEEYDPILSNERR